MRVNFIDRTIELGVKEMKLASQPYTYEYENLLKIMRNLPDFTITVKQPRITHNANRGLTYDYMVQHIMQNDADKLEQFEAVRSLGGYPMTTKWFRTTFPEHSEEVHFCTILQKAV